MTDETQALGVVAGDGTMLVDIGNDGEAFKVDLLKVSVTGNDEQGEMGVDLIGALASETVKHIFYIGLKNILQDSHASVKETDFTTDELWRAAKSGRAQKKLEAIYAGDVRMVAASSGSRGDEVKKVAMQIIERHVRADWKTKGTKFKPEELAAECKKRYAAKTAIWRDLASAQIAREAKELAEIMAANAGEDLTEGL